uniref:Uncharacterized protein n=1 Tax=Glossina brevipalpis TaxID=37001 RepID=A0A1A9WFG0_9MUSC
MFNDRQSRQFSQESPAEILAHVLPSYIQKNHKQELQEAIRKSLLGISFPLLNIFPAKNLSKDLLKPHINANDANDSIGLYTLIIVNCCAKTTTATSTHSPQHAYVVLLAKLLLHALHTFVAVTVIVTNQFLNCKSFGKAYSLTKEITLSPSSSSLSLSLSLSLSVSVSFYA